MSKANIKARLNLYAVLQNLEELVKLDPVAAAMVAKWDTVVQFTVKNGPAAYLAFKDGACRHGIGHHHAPTFKLFFFSCKHINQMFDGTGNPIPLKGLLKLRFLTKEFPKLTERLEYFLKPELQESPDDDYMKICTALTLYTAVHAVPVLAEYDEVSQSLAASTPLGAVQMEILPEGPYGHIVYSGQGIQVGKTTVEHPLAKMIFKDWRAAFNVLTGALDAYSALAQGDMALYGQLLMLDNTSLILDRLEEFLK